MRSMKSCHFPFPRRTQRIGCCRTAFGVQKNDKENNNSNNNNNNNELPRSLSMKRSFNCEDLSSISLNCKGLSSMIRSGGRPSPSNDGWSIDDHDEDDDAHFAVRASKRSRTFSDDVNDSILHGPATAALELSMGNDDFFASPPPSPSRASYLPQFHCDAQNEQGGASSPRRVESFPWFFSAEALKGELPRLEAWTTTSSSSPSNDDAVGSITRALATAALFADRGAVPSLVRT